MCATFFPYTTLFRSALLKDENDEISIIRDAAFRRVRDLFSGATLAADLIDDRKRVLLKKGEKINAESIAEVPRRFWRAIREIGRASCRERVEQTEGEDVLE